MEKNIFETHKQSLIALVQAAAETDPKQKNDLEKILSVLQQYSFENRLRLKGTLAHTGADSLQIDYAVGEKCLEFDRTIR